MNDNQKLINAVLEQIKTDIRNGDLTAIEELLLAVPSERLVGFLSETEGESK